MFGNNLKKIAKNIKENTKQNIGKKLVIGLITFSGLANPLYATSYSAQINNNNSYMYQIGTNSIINAETKTILEFEKDIRNKIYKKLEHIYPKINKIILQSIANNLIDEEIDSSILKQNQVYFEKINLNEKFKVNKNSVILSIPDNKINKIVNFIVERNKNKIKKLINYYEKILNKSKYEQKIIYNFIHIDAQLIKNNLKNKKDIKIAGIIFRKAFPILLKKLKNKHPKQYLLLLQDKEIQKKFANFIIEKVNEYNNNLKQTFNTDNIQKYNKQQNVELNNIHN